MTPASIPGFLTKKEVEEHYGRSHRSITRDFSAAVRRGDAKVLTHLKLQTEDGTVRAGTEATLDQIQEWSNQGLAPTWYVEGEGAAERYGTRSTPTPERASAKTSEPERTTEPTEVRSDLVDLVRRLDQQIQDLRQEMSIKNEQIQQANDRTRESNVLMRELQTLLGNAQERALLARPSQPASDTTQTAVVVEENGRPTEPIVNRTSKAAAAKPRLRPEKGSGGQKSKMKSPHATEDTVAQPKWYEMPTLSKLLRRR